LELVDLAAAPAAGVDFLQADEVVPVHQFRNAIQICMRLRARQQMAPAARDVFAVTLGADAHLHVEAQQRQILAAVSGRHELVGSSACNTCTAYHCTVLGECKPVCGIVPRIAATSTRHALWRRLFLMLVIGGLLLLLALTGWSSFLDHFGGDFSYAPEDEPWMLSELEQASVEATFIAHDCDAFHAILVVGLHKHQR